MTTTTDRAQGAAGTNAVVLGLGVTGLSCARHLAAAGHRVCVMDTRPDPPGLDLLRAELPAVQVVTGGFDEARVLTAELLAVSPGIAADAPLLERARAARVDVAGDIELFARSAAAPTAGITGTNGKSTVTSLLGAMLRAAGLDIAVGGNLGEPALDLLAQAPRDGYVLELSSFQLDLVTRLPLACAAVLNLSVDHLDRYGDMAAYAASKRRIYAHAHTAVYDGDDPRIEPDAGFEGRRVVLRSTTAPGPGEWGLVGTGAATILQAPDGPVLRAAELPIAGRHNAFNVLAAFAMADALGVSREAGRVAIAGFEALPHRCVPVAERAGVRWVDDSKATNVGACRAALEGLDDGEGRLVLIAGGLGKGADFGELREAVATRVHALVLIGRDGELIARALGDLCHHEFAEDMPGAVHAARALARPGDTVLLAPACASFDMFDSYGARGEAFVAAVRALLEEDAS
jgi:UDP-N-acetylmuramoylalanine--D-glutamate ligase